MDKKYILIIVIAAIAIIAAGIFVSNSFVKNIEYETLNLSDTCAVSVPVSNNSTFAEDNGLKTYNDTALVIISYNKNDLNEWENIGANIGVYESLNQNFKYNHTYHGNNILIHPDDNKTIFACLISNNTTGDVVIIETPDEEILYHILDTINFTAKKTNVTGEDDVDEVTETSHNTVEKSDVSSETNNNDSLDESAYEEGYIAENDQDFDYDGDGVGDGSAYHSHEYYVEKGQTEPLPLGGG